MISNTLGLGLARLKATMLFSLFSSLTMTTIFLGALTFLGFYFLGIDLSYAIFATLLLLVLYFFIEALFTPLLIMHSARVRLLSRGENPYLERVVEKICRASNISSYRLGIAEDESPNAFTFGGFFSPPVIVVHRGLLEKMRRDELEAVIAHEVGHIKHKDYLIMTLLSFTPMLSYILGEISLRSTGGEKDERGGSLFIVGIVFMVIYFISLLAIRSLSRMREYYSDLYSAVLTKKPESLVSALVKITYGATLVRSNPILRAFYLNDTEQAKKEMENIRQKSYEYDLNRDGVLDELELEKAMEREARRFGSWAMEAFSTHPPTYKRIKLLRAIEDEIEIIKHIPSEKAFESLSKII